MLGENGSHRNAFVLYASRALVLLDSKSSAILYSFMDLMMRSLYSLYRNWDGILPVGVFIGFSDMNLEGHTAAEEAAGHPRD